MTETIRQAAFRELRRCRKLLMKYENSAGGAFAAYVLRDKIGDAERALGSGDVVLIRYALRELERSK